MGRESTGLDNYNYDSYLAANKKEKELRERTQERKQAHKKDMSGWHFGIDTKPVKVKDMQEFRNELAKRNLSLANDPNTAKQWGSKLRGSRER